MADIYKAYQFLNKALGLGLTPAKLMASEREMKVILAKQQGFLLTLEEADNVEVFAYLRPRRGRALRTVKGTTTSSRGSKKK